jgi:pimeloyl-ACP methyl ester carboxylesterase
MNPVLLIHGYSAESNTSTAQAIRAIYGDLPRQLQVNLPTPVVTLDVSRYITLEDGVTVDDISRALDRALRAEIENLHQTLGIPSTQKIRFNVIIHSTGALVVRNYLRRFWNPAEDCVFERIVYLAGAIHGSALAHLGRTEAAKWIRMIFQGAARGLGVLNCLELGSKWAIQMNLEFQDKVDAAQNKAPMEFAMIGSQPLDSMWVIPKEETHEWGSDGVVRSPAGNPNLSYYLFEAKDEFVGLEGWEVAKLEEKGFNATPRTVRKPERIDEYYHVTKRRRPNEGKQRRVPYALIWDCSHSQGDTSIVDGRRTRDQVLPLVNLAFNTTWNTMPTATIEFDAALQRTREMAKAAPNRRQRLVIEIDPRGQYGQFAQVVFRLFDHEGQPVRHFNIFFNSFGGSAPPRRLINDAFDDAHANELDRNTITFFLRLTDWNPATKQWDQIIDQVSGCTIEIDAQEPDSPNISYLPFRYQLDAAHLKEFLSPYETTVVDIKMQRVPSGNVFKISRA